MDGLFTGEAKNFSPLVGAIYDHNYFFLNLYKYGSESEPGVQLARILFNEVPGGEVTTTHIPNNPASHLSSGLVAKILLFLHNAKIGGNQYQVSDLIEISQKISDLMVSDVGYQKSLQVGKAAIVKAKRAATN